MVACARQVPRSVTSPDNVRHTHCCAVTRVFMEDSQILSTFHEASPVSGNPASARPGVDVLVFDACHVGVVLRAVLFVEAVVAVATMFVSNTSLQWLGQMALITGAALPGTLLWLIVGCSLKRGLARLTAPLQQAAGVLLGALAGLYGCAMLVMMGLVETAPWWASGFAGALLSALLVAALVLRARGKAPAAAAARLAELQARIRPHFLFNTLNSAIALVRDEPRQAERLLEDLSDLFRSALAEQASSVTLGEEIALARSYLAIEQLRFGERMVLEWSLDPLADGARLPPLLLQPLVENAVRHGVEPGVGAAHIRISTQRRGGVVVIKVSNTVPGEAPGSPGHGLALANVRERLALLHDVQARFRVGLKDGIFQVRIEVPA